MSMLPNMTLIADSLGWAVLHSLWQGALAACIVYTVRNFTRERASEARYFTGIITLCALLCAFIGTFLYYYNTGATNGIAANANIGQTITLSLPNTNNTGNPLLQLGDYTGLIGMFWTVCFVVLGVRYLSAFRLTYKLRTHGLSDLTEDCQARFRALVKASGVNPKVRAYFSEYVSSPITFGFLKPIVLVPTWFFTGMTPEQCEAVLLHELAHIRRHDYLTNILQIAIKTVFFYHPAVQFICKGLDTDREHACDDFAVMLTKNPEGLATALGTIRLKAARDGGVFALAADGHDAPLMHRLKRLMGTTSSRAGGKNMQSGTSRGLAATVMIGSALALVMTLGATASQAHPHKPDAVTAPDWDELAGAVTPELDAWGSAVKKKKKKEISVKGKTYTATSFDFSTDGKGTDIINGKEYPSKYAYSVYSRNGAKDGKSYVVKHKNDKRYMEIGDSWYRVDTNGFTRSFVLPTPPVPPTIPTPSSNASAINYWINDRVLATTEAQIERVTTKREAALERAEETRDRELTRTEELRAEAWEQVEEAIERAEVAREEALERAEEAREEAMLTHETRKEGRRIKDIKNNIAKMERKIANKERGLAKDKAGRKRDIAHIERDIAKKQADIKLKLHNNPSMSQRKIGSIYGEIGRLQGRIGRIQSISGRGQGDLGRFQGELGRLQGEIGRAQGEMGRKEASIQQKKYYAMRDRLTPVLKADGYMKSDNSKVTIKMTPTDIFINGKRLAKADKDKYCNIVSDYIDRKSDVQKIVIKPGYLHISQKGDGHNSSFTHNNNQ